MTVPLGGGGLQLVMRDRFDRHILRHAQAEVREGTLMRQVVAGQHGALIETTDGKLLEADYVIGADGANSVVARSIGLRRDRTLVAALEAEVEVPAHVNRQFTRREPVGTARVLLVGDAAGLADPFSGEGIRFAVKSGRLAAQAVLKGEPQRYSDWLFHSIGRSHLRSLRVARFFYRFQRHCLELGAPNPFTTQMIAQLLADCAEPAQVMLWAVLTSPFYLGVEGVAGVTGLFTGAERGQRIRQALYQA